MPPTYKPLTNAGGIQGAPGLPPTVFADPGTTSLEAEMQALALQRAQQLANQSNEITVADKQRTFDNDTQLRNSLKQRFGQQADGTMPDFDSNAMLEVAKKIAAEQGDLDTMLNVTRAQRTLAGDRELTDVEAAQLGVPAGTTLSVARAMQRGQDLDLERNRFNDPLRTRNRDLDADLKEQRVTGTQFQAVATSELTKIQNSEGAMQSISEVKSLLPEIDTGVLSALKSGKVTDLYKDPGSAAYRLYARLELLKKQVARMNDSGALTQLDVDMFAPLTVGSPIYDSQESIDQRMNELAQYIADKKESIIRTNEQGRRNMDLFRIPRAGGQPQLANYGIPRNPDGSKLTREQFMALRSGGR